MMPAAGGNASSDSESGSSDIRRKTGSPDTTRTHQVISGTPREETSRCGILKNRGSGGKISNSRRRITTMTTSTESLVPTSTNTRSGAHPRSTAETIAANHTTTPLQSSSESIAGCDNRNPGMTSSRVSQVGRFTLRSLVPKIRSQNRGCGSRISLFQGSPRPLAEAAAGVGR